MRVFLLTYHDIKCVILEQNVLFYSGWYLSFHAISQKASPVFQGVFSSMYHTYNLNCIEKTN